MKFGVRLSTMSIEKTAVGIILALSQCGCFPVLVHDYYVDDGLLAVTQDNHVYVKIRPTTVYDLTDPGSFGSSKYPGATGFIISFQVESLREDAAVSNVVGFYSGFGHTNKPLAMHPIDQDDTPHCFTTYAIPTSCLVRGNDSYPKILRKGNYHVAVEFDRHGIHHRVAGDFNYRHGMHWKKGWIIGWED